MLGKVGFKGTGYFPPSSFIKIYLERTIASITSNNKFVFLLVGILLLPLLQGLDSEHPKYRGTNPKFVVVENKEKKKDVA